MFNNTPFFHSISLTIELISPMSIGQGVAETGFDQLIVRDANGLPTIPGTSITGMYRALFERLYGSKDTAQLFGGSPTKTGGNKKQGVASNIQISFGKLHDANNKPISGLLTQAQCQADPVLSLLQQDHPIVRERVAISDRGVAETNKKYDVSAVPAGARFSINIDAWFDAPNPKLWLNFQSLLTQPSLRLGSQKFSGFGDFKYVQAQALMLNLTKPEDYQRFCNLSSENMPPLTIKANNALATSQCYKVDYQADSMFRVSGTGQILPESKHNHDDKLPDMLPYAEYVICWESGPSERIKTKAVIPASSLKGAIKHRVEFHLNRLQKRFIEDLPDGTYQPPEALLKLFGYAKSDVKEDAGAAGHLMMTDIYIGSPTIKTITHNAIDRYTNGTIDGALYAEQGLWQCKFSFELNCLCELDEVTQQALTATLDDLVAGRLAIGAGTSRGNGSADPEQSTYNAITVNNKELSYDD